MSVPIDRIRALALCAIPLLSLASALRALEAECPAKAELPIPKCEYLMIYQLNGDSLKVRADPNQVGGVARLNEGAIVRKLGIEPGMVVWDDSLPEGKNCSQLWFEIDADWHMPERLVRAKRKTPSYVSRLYVRCASEFEVSAFRDSKENNAKIITESKNLPNCGVLTLARGYDESKIVLAPGSTNETAPALTRPMTDIVHVMAAEKDKSGAKWFRVQTLDGKSGFARADSLTCLADYTSRFQSKAQMQSQSPSPSQTEGAVTLSGQGGTP